MKSRFNKKPKPSQGPRNLVFAVVFAVGCLAVLTKLYDYTRAVEQLPFSTFLKRVESGDVSKVKMAGQDIYGEFKDHVRFETVVDKQFKLSEFLHNKSVEFEVVPPPLVSFWNIISMLWLIMISLGLWHTIRQARSSGGSGGGGLFGIGKSKAKMFMPSTIKETFASVAGANEAKEDLKDVVDFLKNPQKYQRLGAKITRGVLLVGEPGNGKTLLARAVAGEANCPFFSISGSDFIEVFVGVGAARVRDLFAQARKAAPCIIFIDEIDAVGRARSAGHSSGGHDEREQTLNQLLTEMDGFDTSGESVIILAATNRPDVLDKALLRPGRFDRQVNVPYPDLVSREQILKVHAERIKVDESVDLHKIARSTPGFSGADLASLVNEAAIIASKGDKANVNMHDFEEALDRVTLGRATSSIRMTEKDRHITAIHEGGHALMRLLQPEHAEPVHKVTIVPRGRALGVTHFLPEREQYNKTQEDLLATIEVALGGRIAEELVFGIISSGASSDFVKANEIARNMVCSLGMSPLGPVIYGRDLYGQQNYSEDTASAIDREVRSILDACYKKTQDLLSANRDKLEKLAEALLENETMYASEIYELLGISPRQDFKLV
jgi:cell division protease FtsH